MNIYPPRSRGLHSPRLHVRTPCQSEHDKEMARLTAYMAELDKDPEGTRQMLIEAGILYRHPDGSVTMPPRDPPRLIATFF